MLKVEFISHHRKAQSPPDPAYPDGVDLDLTKMVRMGCETKLPYPAECCGLLMVHCTDCNANAVISTAGRADDPRSVRLACKK